LTLANNDPETVKFEHALRMLWFKGVELKNVSVETALAAFAKGVAETFPDQPKLRFVMQTKADDLLSFSYLAASFADNTPTDPLTQALHEIEIVANVEFVVDRDTIYVKPNLKAIAAEEARVIERKKPYEGLILPKVEFKDAKLDHVLDILKWQAFEASGGKAEPHFIISFPRDPNEARISLRLTNVPFLEVLRDVSTLVGAKVVWRYDGIVLE